MNNESANVNPYQAPTEVPAPVVVAETHWEDFPNQQIPFSIALTPADIRKHYPSRTKLILLVPLIVGSVMFALSISGGMRIVILAGLAILCCGAITLLRASNWKTVIKQSPRIVEPTSGYVSPRGIYVETSDVRSIAFWEDIFSVAPLPDCVLIRGENWRFASLIIPWDGFSSPDAAQQAFKSAENQKKLVPAISAGDQRLLAKPETHSQFPPPDDHVAFEGNVYFGEIARSVPGRQLKRVVMRMLLVGAVLFALGIAIVALGGLTGFVISIPIMVVGYVTVASVLRHPLVKGGMEQPAFNIQGWFSETGVLIHGSTGQQQRDWSSFESVACDENMICLQMRGSAKSWYFLSKNQFANEEEFNRASAWAEAVM